MLGFPNYAKNYASTIGKSLPLTPSPGLNSTDKIRKISHEILQKFTREREMYFAFLFFPESVNQNRGQSLALRDGSSKLLPRLTDVI